MVRSSRVPAGAAAAAGDRTTAKMAKIRGRGVGVAAPLTIGGRRFFDTVAIPCLRMALGKRVGGANLRRPQRAAGWTGWTPS